LGCASSVLEAAYEATLLARILQAQRNKSTVVMLTLLGGGAFGNAQDWIFSTFSRALQMVSEQDLAIRFLSTSSPSQKLQIFAQEGISRKA